MDHFKKLEERQNRLRAELDAAPTMGLTALIGAAPPALFRNGDKPNLLSVGAIAFRDDKSTVHREKLRLRMDVGDDSLQPWGQKIKPYQLLGVTAHVLLGHDEFPATAQIISIDDYHSKDDELARLAEQLQLPVTIDDPQFGTLTLNREFMWFEGNVSWAGVSARIYVEAPNEDATDALVVARQVWSEVHQWDKRIREFAAAELIQTRNDNWLNPGEAYETHASFIEKLTIESVLIKTDGEFEFNFDDGEMFSGHGVTVACSLADGPMDASL